MPLVNYKYYSTELEDLLLIFTSFSATLIDTCLSTDDKATDRNSEIGKWWNSVFG